MKTNIQCSVMFVRIKNKTLLHLFFRFPPSFETHTQTIENLLPFHCLFDSLPFRTPREPTANRRRRPRTRCTVAMTAWSSLRPHPPQRTSTSAKSGPAPDTASQTSCPRSKKWVQWDIGECDVVLDIREKFGWLRFLVLK